MSSLAPYEQGKQEIAGVVKPLKLSSNESMVGPSPSAIAAYKGMADRLALYPDGSQRALRGALAAVHSIDASAIVCGNGSEELIQLVIRAFVEPGDDVVLSQYSFAMAFIHAKVQGARIIVADEPGLRPDADRILAAITPKTKIVIVASPNNPVGQYMPRNDLHRLADGIPSNVILLLDGAYADYVEADDFDAGEQLVETRENVVMTRTFSKLYGLAGLRIGWMYAPPGIVDAIQRIRTPFNANSAALAAAEAAVLDTDHAARVRRENSVELTRIEASLAASGMEFISSAANFYLLRFEAKGHDAGGAAKFLESRGIIPRPVNAGGPAGCLRITVGRPDQNDRVIAALLSYMKD
ncbi:MAG: histidinol-phosphate transaminase [Sphingorhabdus sp.]